MDHSSPEHKDIYEIDIKDGNRIGRRLGRGIGGVAGAAGGGGAGKGPLITEPFDPNAYDGDGDGIIQDGTVWKRPVVLRAQSVPGLPSPKAEESSREAVGEADTTDRPSISADATKPKKGTRAGLRSSTTPDTTSREWRDTATPQELAEAFVPETRAETDRLAELTNVRRSDYANEADYETALALHREFVFESERGSAHTIASLKSVYDSKYGDGAFDSDSMSTLHENIQSLFGSDKQFSDQFSITASVDELRTQYAFIQALIQNPTIPPRLKEIFREIEEFVNAQEAINHSSFWYPDNNTRTLQPYPVSPMEYVMARLVGEKRDSRNRLMQGNLMGRELDEEVTPTQVTALVDGWSVAQAVMKLYFDYRNDDKGSRALSDDQIEARFELAKQTNTRKALFGTVFPTNAVERNHTMSESGINTSMARSSDPRDYKMLRALVQRALEDNPEFLTAVRQYGMPPLFVPHRAYSILRQPDGLTERLLVTPLSELSPSELRERRLIGQQLKDERLSIEKLKGTTGQQPENGGINVLGSAHFRLGGSYEPGSNRMLLTTDWLLISMLNPPTADDGIIPLSRIRSLDDFIGEAGVLLHEYGHYMDFVIQSTLAESMWEKARRRLQVLEDLEKTGTPHPDAVRMRAKVIEDFMEALKALPPQDGHGDAINRQRTYLNRLRNLRGEPKIPRIDPNARTVGPILSNPSALSDAELDAQIQELTGQIMEIHGDELLRRRREMLDKSRRAGQRSTDTTEDIADDSTGSPEPYVITPYGNTNTRERLAEITAATLSRIGQKYPVLINNAAVKLMSRLTGMSTEQQDVTTLTRRRKMRGGDSYSDQTEDITKRIISTIKLVSPDSERTSDGHRPGLGSSTTSSSLRFDPDERSRLESASNIGIDTDERLYAFSEPLYVRDFPSKPRTYSIGDHHFYDDDIPFGSRASSGQRGTLGTIAAQAFTNRNRPHHGDMMRAISATQFGMFIDDMPTYKTTTAGQLRVLRGLVTGKISKLNPSEREQIERAFKDANNLHQMIQMSQPTKRDIYRAINIDSETFMESLTVGDIIPMPLTTFGADAPRDERGVILRLVKGAKAVDDNGSFITQGNFEVTSIGKSDTGVLTATIRHTGVFDPRHNAMRAVDKDADTPRSMRSMGGSRPRYNESQVLRMETDLSQRRDRAAAFGLRSTTRSDSEINEMLDNYVEAVNNDEDIDGEEIIATVGPYIKDFIGDSVARRLGKTLLQINNRYNGKTPWVADTQALQSWREIPHETAKRVQELLSNIIRARINDGEIFNTDGTPKPLVSLRAEGESLTTQEMRDLNFKDALDRWAASELALTATQIRHFLRTGELTHHQRHKFAPEPYFIKIPEIKPLERGLLADEKSNQYLDDFEELQRVLEITADALEAVQRAYLMDGSENEGQPTGDVWTGGSTNGVVSLGDTDIEIHPHNIGVHATLSSTESQGGMEISVSGTFAKRGALLHDVSDGFERVIRTTPRGKVIVSHERMWINDKSLKSSGLGTFFNQHAALWWRRLPDGEFSLPTPAAEGVIVWPRMGYSVDISGTSNGVSEFMRRRNNLVRSVMDAIRDGEAGVATDPLFRQRLIGWLALARKQDLSGKPNPELVTLLANIIDTKKLTKDNLKAWNKIFYDSSITELGLIMGFDKEEDGASVDDDWLPEFLIPDPSGQPLDYVEERRNARAREQILQTAFSTDKDIERDLFIGTLINTESMVGGKFRPMTSEQAGRLYGTLVGRRERLAHVREKYGFNTTPTLFTRADLNGRVDAMGSPLYGIGDINPRGESTSLPRFISGTGDSSTLITFTSEPWRHLPEMYVDGLPNSDPANTRNGIIGYLAPWAQVVEADDIIKALNDIVPGSETDPYEAQKYLSEENFDGLLELIAGKHFRKYEYKPGRDGRPGLDVYDESFAFNTRPFPPPIPPVPFGNYPYTPIRNRILKAIMDLENGRLVQGHSGSLAAASKMLETRNALLTALFGDKPDRYNIAAALLGYDAVRDGNNTTVLNNGAMSVMDEVISFAEAAKLLDDPTYRVIPENAPLGVTGDADWFSDSNERLLMRDEAIVFPSNGVIPSSYIRSVRQDFNVDLSERKRGRGLSTRTTDRVSKILSMEQTMRRFDRQPNTDGWENPDDNDFKKKLADLKLRYQNLIAEDEAWDEANMDLDDPDWDAHKEIQSRKNAIIDHMTSLILTSNMVIEQAIEHEAAIQALAGFLKERDGDNALKDIPRDVLQAMDDMLNTLMNEANDKPSILSIDKARKRHVMLKRVLSDFDLGYDVRHSAAEFGDDDIELEDVDADVDVMDKSEAYLEHLFRGLFDENYDKWSERWSGFDRFISPENRSADDVMDRRFRELFKEITTEQRREWHATSGQLLDDEYNWEYEEDIIDATPVGGSTRPSEVPAPTWRKIRSAMSRARSTTFDGEKQAAEEAALRLIGKHRPDLATREYVRGIRSSTSGSLPSVRVNFATKPMRGSAPDAPSTPVANHSLSITADKLRALGHDVTEADLLPNGKVGAVMRALTSGGGWHITVGLGEQDTLKTGAKNNADLELFLMAVEKGLISKSSLGSNSPELIRDLVNITVEQARKQGLSVIKVEGHSSKKVLGPIDDEIIDILGDEVDIALLRAHGAPTYEQLVDIAAFYYAEKKRLNKMFGEIDNETPSQHARKGAYGRTMNNDPVLDGNTLRYVDDRGNEVASFDLSDRAAVEEIMGGIIAPFRNKQPRSLASVLKIDKYDSGRGLNDVIFGVMAEAVGYEYKNERGTTGLAGLRKELESIKSLIALYSFSPSPAGQHLRSMFEDKITSKQMQVDLMEKMGQRYIHLFRERGLSDEDIRTTLKTLMLESEARSRYEGRFINGEPVLISKGTILQQALTGFLRKNLASPSVPMFTDGDVNNLGFHEIGHFALGQAFTRHGEFVANAWPMFVHGRAFWWDFAASQRNQTDQFDQWTIKEHFGRVITSDQLLAITGSSNARDTVDSVARQRIKHLGLSDEDRAVVRDDVIKSVRARNDISDVEKQQVIDDINYTYDQGDFFITSTSQRKPATKAVDEMSKLVDIPAELWDSNAESTRTSAFYDPLVPIPSRLFGWQRTERKESSGLSSKTASGYTKVKGGRDGLPGRDLGKMRSELDFEEEHPDAVKEAKKLQDQALKYFMGLSPAELEAIDEYIVSSFMLNHMLRYGDIPPRGPGSPVVVREEIIRRAEKLTDILENAPRTKQPMVLYRGLGDIFIDDYQHLLDLGVNGEFSDDGIISTSWNPEMSNLFVTRNDSEDIPLLEIILPKNSKALSVMRFRNNEDDSDGYSVPNIGEAFGRKIVASGEQEVLLPPGTKFKIVAIIPPNEVSKHDGVFSPGDEPKAKIIVEVIP